MNARNGKIDKTRASGGLGRVERSSLSRRAFMCLASLTAWGIGGAPAESSERPLNVVVIYADDLGWGDIGVQGAKRWRTPHIDRLASQGARLTNFQSPYPYCAPSRAALQTGRYPFRSGVSRNPTPDAGINDVGIPSSEITLGEAFRDAGYRTACIGKWHLGHKPEFYPTRHGYHEYLGILYSNDMHPVNLMDGERIAEYPVDQATLTKRYTERAIAFLEKNRERPFFLYLPHAMPHKPLAASSAFYGKSGGGPYGDAVAELDWSVGEILRTLDRLRLAERTLVVFSSDNGPWYGGSAGGLRGMKGQTWEGGLRVPMIARLPGKIPAGHVSHEPAIVMDLYVTCLKLAGIGLPKDRVLDGKDITPLLTSGAKSPHDAIFSFKAEKLCAVRSGKWKLHLVAPGPARERVWKPGEVWIDPRRPDGIRMIAPKEQIQPREFPGIKTGDPFQTRALFDLEADPAEQRNVADKHPEIVASLQKKYEAMRAEAE